MSGLFNNIYLRSPVILKQIAIACYGWRLNHLRFSGRVEDDYCVDFLFGKSQKDLERYQLAQINRTLEVARSIPFYRDRLPTNNLNSFGEMADILTLDKAQIRQAGNTIINSAVPRRDRITGHTSGSTGTPLTYYHSTASVRRMFSLYRSFKAWHGIAEGDRRVRFGGRLIIPFEQKRPPYWLRDYASNSLYLSLLHMSETTLGDYVEAIARFGAREFSGYPSSIYTLADYCLRHGITSLRPHCIITDSETLLDYQREAMEQAFACKVFDYYGISETQGIFAGQCSAGSYHLFPQAAYVEILDEEAHPIPAGDVGLVYVTTLTNDCMPLIRYRVGDLAAISDEVCSCGLQTHLLSNLEGRTDDTVTTLDGRKIGRLDHIFKQGGEIREAQIIQERPGHFTFLIVPGPGFSQNTLKLLEVEAQQRLGESSRFDFQIIETIPRTERGKFRSVVVRP